MNERIQFVSLWSRLPNSFDFVCRWQAKRSWRPIHCAEIPEINEQSRLHTIITNLMIPRSMRWAPLEFSMYGEYGSCSKTNPTPFEVETLVDVYSRCRRWNVWSSNPPPTLNILSFSITSLGFADEVDIKSFKSWRKKSSRNLLSSILGSDPTIEKRVLI